MSTPDTAIVSKLPIRPLALRDLLKAYRQLRKKAPKTEDTAEDDLRDLGTNSPNPDSEPKKKDPILSRFLEDKDGNPVSESQKKAIFATAAAFWQYLLDNNRAPKMFCKANIEIKLKWQMLMESNFKCLRYCDSHWKVDQIWINYYPPWLKTALRKIEEEKEKLRAKREAEDAVINVDGKDDKNEDEDDNDEDNVEDVEERARVEEPENSTPPPHPAPTKITTNHARVNPLAHVRATPAIRMTPVLENDLVSAGNEPPSPGLGDSPPGASSDSLDSGAPCSVSGSSSCDSVNTPTSPAAPTSTSDSAPVSAPVLAPSTSQNDSHNASPAPTSTPDVLIDTQTSQSTSPRSPVISATASASESSTNPATSDPSPVISSNDMANSGNTTSTVPTSNTSQSSAPAKGSCKTAAKKAPQPKKMARSKQLCYEEWKKDNQDAPHNDFEKHWKGLPRSAKVVYNVLPSHFISSYVLLSRLEIYDPGQEIGVEFRTGYIHLGFRSVFSGWAVGPPGEAPGYAEGWGAGGNEGEDNLIVQ
ncbi:hypothetical protein BDM02DRAFT_3133221 [Thelephora ganbajun]|uniref:Uncharacterized protein n=1 Tax=Thelephora ganbajun TaxID=370292 RepID=A0ACB6YZD3_THEGA|nr:hypothetical protein BDM02DRAFT_3133221 [Thelephora ganbajun]